MIKSGCFDISDDSSSSDCQYDKSEQSDESAPLCTIRKHQINPDDLITSDGVEWHFDKNFSQRIEVELCENAGLPCAHYSKENDANCENENEPCAPKMKTKCRQKFISIQLQVMLKNSTISELKSFRIPSNCECIFFRH